MSPKPTTASVPIEDGETCATDGSNHVYSELLTADSREISTNHCPNHAYYDINPNRAIATGSTYRIPLSPMYSPNQETDLSARGGGIGVLFDGGFLFSAYGGPNYGQVSTFLNSAPYAEGDTFDQCVRIARVTLCARDRNSVALTPAPISQLWWSLVVDHHGVVSLSRAAGLLAATAGCD